MWKILFDYVMPISIMLIFAGLAIIVLRWAFGDQIVRSELKGDLSIKKID